MKALQYEMIRSDSNELGKKEAAKSSSCPTTGQISPKALNLLQIYLTQMSTS